MFVCVRACAVCVCACMREFMDSTNEACVTSNISTPWSHCINTHTQTHTHTHKHSDTHRPTHTHNYVLTLPAATDTSTHTHLRFTFSASRACWNKAWACCSATPTASSTRKSVERMSTCKQASSWSVSGMPAHKRTSAHTHMNTHPHTHSQTHTHMHTHANELLQMFDILGMACGAFGLRPRKSAP